MIGAFIESENKTDWSNLKQVVHLIFYIDNFLSTVYSCQKSLDLNHNTYFVFTLNRALHIRALYKY